MSEPLVYACADGVLAHVERHNGGGVAIVAVTPAGERFSIPLSIVQARTLAAELRERAEALPPLTLTDHERRCTAHAIGWVSSSFKKLLLEGRAT